jgi:hypothetical protein
MNSTSTLQPLSEEEVARLQTGTDTPDTSGNGGGADDGDGSVETSISDDELFHLLQNSRRRAVIRYLRGREGPIRMRDVAEQVAAWEHDTTVAHLSSDERQRVYIALYQSHLETLEDAGVIDYNKPRGVIHPRPLLDRVAIYIDAGRRVRAGDAEKADDDTGNAHDGWTRRYVGVSVVGSLLLVGTTIDITGLGTLSTFGTSVLILLAFSALTLAKLALEGDDTDPAVGVE